MDKQENSGFVICQQPKPVSVMKIGKEQTFNFMTDIKFNKLQKFMWKKFFNVVVEDYKDG